MGLVCSLVLFKIYILRHQLHYGKGYWMLVEIGSLYWDEDT